MQVIIEPNYIYLKVPYEERHKAKLLGAKWNDSRKMWRFQNNLYVMRELVQVFPELRNNARFMEYGQKKKAQQDKLLQIKAQEDAPGDPRLRPYQRVDVEYIKQLPHAGIFNEQRTGKSVIALRVFEEEGRKKNCIVCPASLVHNWANEVRKWTDKTPFPVIGDRKKRMKIYEQFKQAEEGYLIISYETLRRDIDIVENLMFDGLIVDEIHRVRHRDTQQSQAVFRLGKKAKKRLALTGTPTVKDLTDIFGILQFLYPDRFTSFWEFVERYFITIEDFWGRKEFKPNAARQKELQELVGFISVQRKRAEVMKWLPPKQRQTLFVEMEEKQRKAYESMRKTFVVQLENGEAIDAPSVLAQLLRLRQICLAPELLGIDAPSAKENALMEWLEDNAGEPVVVMSWFTSYLKILAEKLKEKGYRVGMIHGEISAEEKYRAAQEFQAGRLDVLLCNIISAGVGLTLDRAETIIFLDKAFNPSENEQAEDRIVPISEERNHSVNIISIVCRDSIDEKINQLLEEKINITSIINSGSREAIRKLLQRIS